MKQPIIEISYSSGSGFTKNVAAWIQFPDNAEYVMDSIGPQHELTKRELKNFVATWSTRALEAEILFYVDDSILERIGRKKK